jgi:apolipoprotein N-acyltransferase
MTINALFMATIFQFFHLTKRIIGRKEGYIGLILFWLAWEYVHISWDLTWPWLTLGNGFANSTSWIQWYDTTGVPGGSLWILVVNILLYHGLKHGFQYGWNQKSTFKYLFATFMLLVVPSIISWVKKGNYSEENNPVEIVVVQPNIDPYNEKFNGLSSQEQVYRMMKLAAEKVTDSTRYVVVPETAIPESIQEDLFKQSGEYKILKSFVEEFPNVNIVIGASTLYVYGVRKPNSPTVRRAENGIYYDYYNTALQINFQDKIPFYHKSKLVPGVERMPFPQLFLPLQDLIFDLGGTTGSLGTQETRDVFYSAQDSTGIAPVICYESVYGEYVGNYVLNGANLIFIITNDGWWQDTPGYKQHLAYARLRAIEHRRSIARSANTGISCFIDQTGNVTQKTGWWEPDVIAATLNKNTEITFYTKYGDYISRTSALFSGFLLLLVFLRSRTQKTKNK